MRQNETEPERNRVRDTRKKKKKLKNAVLKRKGEISIPNV